MADEDDQNVRMPMGDGDYVAEDSGNDDDIRRGENENMDDLGEDESDDDESLFRSEDYLDDSEEEEDNDDDEVEDEIVDKFIRTFHNGDYDQEFDDALSSDRSAVVPNTRPTQASYNKLDNWVERNRIGLEKVKEQLQDCINNVTRYNSFNLELRHNSYGHQLMDNEEPIVWHEPILDEYWDQLETEIDRVRQLGMVTKIDGIHIENVEIKKERLAMLVAIFRSGRAGATNSSTMFNIDNANLCADGIISLSELVDVSPELHCFCLAYNRIDSMDSARCLSGSLKSHTRINDLRLTHCDLGSNPEILSVILQSDVKYINLDNNNIDSLGAVKIAEYLESDPPIEELTLDHNRLNDDDAILISQALKRNTNLKTIHLYTNNLTSIGVKSLLSCVFDGSSLNAISESNHRLAEMDIFWRGNNETSDRLQDCIDRMLELDRRTEKILLALRDKDSLLQYLANVPVELITEVLAFPQRVVNQPQHKHLNIVYSTMRWWNMPMLYSYHSCVKV